MIEQEALIARLRRVCIDDALLAAALLAGSFALGEADRFSDLDIVLFFRDEALPGIDRRAWVEQLAPVDLFFPDQFGHFTAIFSSLVRAEFSFKAENEMAVVGSWRGSAWFPDPEVAILVDRTGDLLTYIRALQAPISPRDTPDQIAALTHNLTNYLLFGASVLARGEAARALTMLDGVHTQLLHLARLVEGVTVHWPTPSRLLERELSEPSYRRFAACTAPLERQAVWRAYRESLRWGREMIQVLAQRVGTPMPVHVLDRLGDEFRSLEELGGSW
jgi:lincosamide nucleotidyltransferase